jgi:hypothetical protein
VWFKWWRLCVVEARFSSTRIGGSFRGSGSLRVLLQVADSVLNPKQLWAVMQLPSFRRRAVASHRHMWMVGQTQLSLEFWLISDLRNRHLRLVTIYLASELNIYLSLLLLLFLCGYVRTCLHIFLLYVSTTSKGQASKRKQLIINK